MKRRVKLDALEAKLDAREGYWKLVLDVELTMRELISRVREAEGLNAGCEEIEASIETIKNEERKAALILAGRLAIAVENYIEGPVVCSGGALEVMEEALDNYNRQILGMVRDVGMNDE